MSTSPEEIIRQYLDQNQGQIEVPVDNLLTTWQLQEWSEDERRMVANALSEAGVKTEPPLPNTDKTASVRLFVEPEPSLPAPPWDRREGESGDGGTAARPTDAAAPPVAPGSSGPAPGAAQQAPPPQSPAQPPPSDTAVQPPPESPQSPRAPDAPAPPPPPEAGQQPPQPQSPPQPPPPSDTAVRPPPESPQSPAPPPPADAAPQASPPQSRDAAPPPPGSAPDAPPAEWTQQFPPPESPQAPQSPPPPESAQEARADGPPQPAPAREAEEAPSREQRVAYVDRKENLVALAALVCGITGVAVGVVAALENVRVDVEVFVAVGAGIAAIVLGLLGRQRATRDPQIGQKAIATYAIVVGIVAVAMGLAGWVGPEHNSSGGSDLEQQLDQQLDESTP